MKNPRLFFPPSRPFGKLPDGIGIFDRAGSGGVFLGVPPDPSDTPRGIGAIASLDKSDRQMGHPFGNPEGSGAAGGASSAVECRGSP